MKKNTANNEGTPILYEHIMAVIILILGILILWGAASYWFFTNPASTSDGTDNKPWLWSNDDGSGELIYQGISIEHLSCDKGTVVGTNLK